MKAIINIPFMFVHIANTDCPNIVAKKKANHIVEVYQIRIIH